MSKKLEILGNYFVATDSSDGSTWECPAKDLRYQDVGESVTFKDSFNDQPDFSERLADLRDSNDVVFASYARLVEFLRGHTGGNPAGSVYDHSNIVMEYLKDTGSNAMNVDGSVTPVRFFYAPPTGYEFVCSRMVFYMEDATSFDSTLFGGGVALTNGWSIQINGTEIINSKSNRETGSYMFDLQGVKIYAKEDKATVGRLTFSKFAPGGIVIQDGQKFESVIQDDLTGLTYFECRVEGYLRRAT